MDLIAPLAKLGLISESLNLWLAIPTGFIFGFGLYHSGFTDSRNIASAFYMKDMGVPVVMFSAIVTAMLGLWGLGLLGVIDIGEVYFLPTFLVPMAVAGFLFGIGMVMGGFCPGTAVASMVTGRIDAAVFVVGVFIGSLLFGDFYPLWADFYNSSYQGVMRLDRVFGMGLGVTILLMVLAAIGGSLMMRFGQHWFWKRRGEADPVPRVVMHYEAPLVALAVVLALVMAFFPTGRFIDGPDGPDYYIVPKQPLEAPAAPTPGEGTAGRAGQRTRNAGDSP